MINFGKDVPFQRIRRITGYLTGDLSTWNNAKQAEEKDRVTHGMHASAKKTNNPA